MKRATIGIGFWTGENKYGCVIVNVLSKFLFLVPQTGGEG